MITSTGECNTLPARSLGYDGPNPAEDFVEPFLVILAHQRDDRWLMAHECTYAIYRRSERVTTNNSVRVQLRSRAGAFLGHEERVRALTT